MSSSGYNLGLLPVIPTRDGRELVVWSGGADSTLILARLAEVAPPKKPVVAITVTGHPQIDGAQMRGQREARKAFLALAKARKWPIQVLNLRLDGPGNGVSAANGQALLWLLSALPYVAKGDGLHLGYIRGDDFWHSKHTFEEAFRAVCRFKEVEGAEVLYPLEWFTKTEVLEGLQSLKIPPRCIWTCESPANRTGHPPVQCGRCSKCKELLRACEALPDKPSRSKKAALNRTVEMTAALSKLRSPNPPNRPLFRW